MKISISKTHTEEVTIPVPSFWKSGNERYYTALVDEKTAITLNLYSDGSTYIKHGSPEDCVLKSEIAKAHNEHTICTEDEFMSTYNHALWMISLEPKELKAERDEVNDTRISMQTGFSA